MIGSVYGRTSRKPGISHDKSIALKDLDFAHDDIKIKLSLVLMIAFACKKWDLFW